ncbi:hypothetical protein [Leucobacter chromiireducens]|uniref:hypothetical protein n=1 Tax=Leucobacter chromiireducens TaxID=283877 RepID=UPI0019269909|nr:hypothetical protein [Leucobacter chromiireducens]
MTQSEVITVLIAAGVIALLVTVWRIDRSRRTRDGSVLSGTVSAFDNVFHPEAARAAEIREIQRELPAEAPSPGDPPQAGLFSTTPPAPPSQT